MASGNCWREGQYVRWTKVNFKVLHAVPVQGSHGAFWLAKSSVVVHQKLQSCVVEDDAVIILAAGNENLRYVTGDAVCITHDKIEYLDLTRLAMAKAAEMLNNPLYSTVCEY